VLSCRTEFLADTLSDALTERLRTFQHTGFKEVSRDAIRQFLDWYDIERLSFPMLDPEFTNPLFLKLLCTTLQTRGEHRFPRTGIGTSWIYDSFLDAIDDRTRGPGALRLRPQQRARPSSRRADRRRDVHQRS
jgi:hypothetical protein